METKYLDSQLKGYRLLDEQGKLPDNGKDQLKELEAIKQALNIDNVSESFDKQELREAYNSGAVNISCYGECMVDQDKDFNDCVEWIIKERD